MHIEDQQLVQSIILTAFIVPIVLSGLLIGFIIFYQKKNLQRQLEKKDHLLREQNLKLEKHLAIEQERNRIASEMHDDLGSGLTTIKYLSEKALLQAETNDDRAQIQKIADQSQDLIRNMSEIIWALNLRNDNLGNLLAYLRRYSSEYLEDNRLKILWDQAEIPQELKVTGEKRRNVFLVVKELLHNIVKHAGATEVDIDTVLKDQSLTISIKDNGSGFDYESGLDQGNGLYNLARRIDSINGSWELKSDGKGTLVEFTFPLDEDMT